MSMFLSIDSVPVHIGLLWDTCEDARACPTGRIDLCYCDRCGFVSNTSFTPQLLDYSLTYDNALDFSPIFQEYSRSLASDLISRHNLHAKDIIEIGSGKGDFLKLICELGENRGVGFDPSCQADGNPGQSTDGITFIKDIYSERYREYAADLIVCRQVFEHILDPRGFLSGVRRTIADRGTAIFFELPDLRNILEQFSIWAIIYEHCSYFTSESLRAVFARCDFDVHETPRLYLGQFVGVHAGPGACVTPPEPDLNELGGLVRSFSTTFDRMLAEWRQRMDDMRAKGQKAVVWGAGARGTSFVNLLDTKPCVEYVVDINPSKKGKFLAGTGHEIVNPAQLRTIRPDVVIVVNPIYMDEVREITNAHGVSPEFISA